MLTHADLDADLLRGEVAAIEAALPPGAWPCWAGSNHDIGRLATRWAAGDDALARCALMVLLTLRGTPCLYYGDELALDLGRRYGGTHRRPAPTPSRDPGRTPMPWTPGGGWDGPVASAHGDESKRRRSARRLGLDTPLHSRPHRVAARIPAPAVRSPTRRSRPRKVHGPGGEEMTHWSRLNLGGDPVRDRRGSMARSHSPRIAPVKAITSRAALAPRAVRGHDRRGGSAPVRVLVGVSVRLDRRQDRRGPDVRLSEEDVEVRASG